MNYQLLKTLVDYLQVYQSQQQKNTIEDFVIWLNGELFSDKGDKEHTDHDQLLISFKIMLLNKKIKKQTKPVLAGSKLSSVDDYSFLLHLQFQESFRKMEIIELHHLEAPTGIEIIKRLLKHKLIEEFMDEDDKRAKRISITKTGTKEMESVKPQMDKIFFDFTQALSLNEKINTSGLLDRLIEQEPD